jgi:hypothetical protein
MTASKQADEEPVKEPILPHHDLAHFPEYLADLCMIGN